VYVCVLNAQQCFLGCCKIFAVEVTLSDCGCACVGHYLDQKRLKQGLYRHPWDDISYVVPELHANSM